MRRCAVQSGPKNVPSESSSGGGTRARIATMNGSSDSSDVDAREIELPLLETLSPGAWNAEHAARFARPAWTVTAPVRRYAVPVDDATVDALGTVSVECAAVLPARAAAVLFGDFLVWSGAVRPPRSHLTCGGVNLLHARARGRGVEILVVAPADADVRVTATVKQIRGRQARAAYEARGLLTMD